MAPLEFCQCAPNAGRRARIGGFTMANPILESFHPLHLRYVIANPLREENNLNNFFDALKTVDPLERRWMVGFASAAVGTKSIPELPSVEDESDTEVLYFRNRCADILGSGVANFFLSYGIVSYICNLLRMQGDPQFAKANIKWLQGFMEFFEQRSPSGVVSQGTADKMSRMAEERINNCMADTELMRDRYNLFCDKVVRIMLPQIPGPGG